MLILTLFTLVISLRTAHLRLARHRFGKIMGKLSTPLQPHWWNLIIGKRDGFIDAGVCNVDDSTEVQFTIFIPPRARGYTKSGPLYTVCGVYIGLSRGELCSHIHLLCEICHIKLVYLTSILRGRSTRLEEVLRNMRYIFRCLCRM